jgi:hypothetical protein
MAIADALITQKTLDGAEIAAVLAGRHDVFWRKQWMAMAAGAEQFNAMTGGLKRLAI